MSDLFMVVLGVPALVGFAVLVGAALGAWR